MSFIQKYKKWIVVSSILLAFTSFYYYFMKEPTTSELIIETEEPSFLLNESEEIDFIPAEQENEEKKLVVDIKGAVAHPGVYKLELGARVHQLIDLAGGLNEEADEMSINLAAPLEDGMMIYIYKKGEVKGDDPLLSGAGNVESKGKVNLNLATSEELQTLTGIGPSKAEAIITFREENGPFTSPEDLLEVSGIGEKSLEKIKEDITIK